MTNYIEDKNLKLALLQDEQVRNIDTFSSLLELYRPRILRYLTRKVQDPDLAEELTQETLLKAYIAMPTIDKNFKFSSWIFTIARNVCIDYWRYAKVRPISVPYNAEQLASMQKIASFEDPLETNELKETILKILNHLSMRQKTAIVLRDIEGYCYKEAAFIMNLTEAAFTSLLYRARINFVQKAVPALYPKAKEIGFRYKECLTLVKTFSLSDWPDDPAQEITLKSCNYFDHTAENFDFNRSSDYPKKIDEYLLAKASNTNNLVGADFGSGSGHLAVLMAGKFRQVKALDIAPQMIKCATMKMKRKGVCNVSLNLGDINYLPYSDESIDFAYCTIVLHHIFNPEQCIREMVRTIKPGGSLIIADFEKHQEDSLHEKMRDFWSGFEEKQFITWLKMAGLENIWIERPENFKFNFDVGDKIAKPSLIVAGGQKPIYV